PRRRVRARRRRVARRADVPGEPARAPSLPGQAPRRRGGRARTPAAAGGVADPRRPLHGRARGDVPRRGAVARLRPRRRPARVRRLPRELAVVAALAIARTFPDSGLGLYLKLAAATLAVLAVGSLLARLLGRPTVSAT